MSEESKKLMAAAKEAAANRVTNKAVWLRLMGRAKELPESVTGIARWSIMRLALESYETQPVIREVMLELYEKPALNGDVNATRMLESYARQSGDKELLSRFREETTGPQAGYRTLRRVHYQAPAIIDDSDDRLPQ